MKNIVLLIITLLSFSAWSQNLQTGDILLQPLNCRLCNLIEAEENTIYSHMGLVVARETETYVIESFGSGVKIVTFAEFNKKTQRGQKLLHLRFKDEAMAKYISDTQTDLTLLLRFKSKYEGLQYDGDFRWDNVDENGKEKLYCSELVVKLLNEVMVWDYPIKRMHFSQHFEEWDRYFGGNTPIDEWGNSPGDFEKSSQFVRLGEI